MDELSLKLENVNFKNVEKENVMKKIENIKDKFIECKFPCTDKDKNKLIIDLKEYKIDNPDIPEELKILWNISSEWHLIEDHHNVFGFNIFSPKEIIKITNDIFGDENVRKEWLEDLGNNSCGNKSWICISSYSEYDYIFVNVNKKSKYFGGTRHMINNCTIDNELTKPPFVNYINYVKEFIENINSENNSS